MDKSLTVAKISERGFPLTATERWRMNKNPKCKTCRHWYAPIKGCPASHWRTCKAHDYACKWTHSCADWLPWGQVEGLR